MIYARIQICRTNAEGQEIVIDERITPLVSDLGVDLMCPIIEGIYKCVGYRFKPITLERTVAEMTPRSLYGAPNGQ